MSLRPWTALVVPPALDGNVVSHMLDMLMALDMDYLREHPHTPSIYAAGVRYIPEPRGQESWLAIPWVMQFGGSVCHSLAAWRAAELRVRGIDAWPRWSVVKQSDGSELYHVRVLVGKNSRMAEFKEGVHRIEDPSAFLGMGQALQMSQQQVRVLGPTHDAAQLAARGGRLYFQGRRPQ